MGMGMDFEDQEDQFDLKLFDHLPVGVLTLDDDFRVKSANQFARQLLQLQPGADVRTLVHPDCREAFDLLFQHQSTTAVQIQFKFGDNSLYTKIHLAEASTLIVEDISELVALGQQLKGDKQPERKFVHELSNALTTTLGYTELINMILQEHDEFSGERLATVRRYEAEVFDGLKRADAIIKNRKQGPAQQF